MDTASPDVLLLRSPDDPDPYLQAFEAVGYTVACEPALRFAFPNQQALRNHLRRAADFAALIATSPRVGRALHQAYRTEPDLRAHWQGRRAYAVGPKTARWLRKLGLDVSGEDTGTAAALGNRLASKGHERPLLFLSGNRRRETLPDALHDAGVAFEEQVVYETKPRSTLAVPSPAETDWLVVFSPSGLEALSAAQVPLAAYRVAAIGPTTAGALRTAGETVAAVADAPNPDALVQAIRDADAT
ncbi:MAG: uroporphyrinogen-III synthase [Salinibacter sp.]